MIHVDLARQEDLPTKYARIKYFKTYSEPRQYGEKLCGFRAYDKEEECVLSAGWFDPQYLLCKKFLLADNEVINGISTLRHEKDKFAPAVHYDAKFIIREVNLNELDLTAPR